MNKITRYRQLCFELCERREGFTVNVIPMIIGCLGGGIKELKESLKRIFENDNDKELDLTLLHKKCKRLYSGKATP